ncbi:hypothetical protein E2C01_051991 [Portunus trituberculatus]|uniref:Uncharacterized protein n=1 Tax=Portunus trituberculatus TaxID=210409 RepID=A0A5B7GK98_PORTR|nr:hypothetical protein [Portunus trituberculatus]
MAIFQRHRNNQHGSQGYELRCFAWLALNTRIVDRYEWIVADEEPDGKFFVLCSPCSQNKHESPMSPESASVQAMLNEMMRSGRPYRLTFLCQVPLLEVSVSVPRPLSSARCVAALNATWVPNTT